MNTLLELEAPCLLIKVPQQHEHQEHAFFHAVVLIVSHNAQGSMGLVLTRPTDTTIESFAEALELSIGGEVGRSFVFDGGPVEPSRAFLLHTSPQQGPETEVLFEDVRFSFSLETLKLLAEQPEGALKVIQGYAGWGPGQLGQELAAGTWLVGTADHALIFDVSSEALWETCLAKQHILPMQLGFFSPGN